MKKYVKPTLEEIEMLDRVVFCENTPAEAIQTLVSWCESEKAAGGEDACIVRCASVAAKGTSESFRECVLYEDWTPDKADAPARSMLKFGFTNEEELEEELEEIKEEIDESTINEQSQEIVDEGFVPVESIIPENDDKPFVEEESVAVEEPTAVEETPFVEEAPADIEPEVEEPITE